MNTQAGSSKRPPKLLYRTPSVDAFSVKTGSSSGGTSLSVNTAATSPLSPDFRLSPKLSPSGEVEPPISRLLSVTPSSLSTKTPSDTSKKRQSLFTGIFSVKEPSAQALVDYQKHLHKQANGRVTASGLPGVSSAKLPPTVPKTNSKWDGVPQAVKERDRQQERVNRQSMSGQSIRLCKTESSESDVRPTSTPSSRNRHSRGTLGGSSAYSTSSNRLADLYGWEKPSSSDSSSVVSKDFAVERPSTSRSTSAWSAPPLQPNSKFPPHEASYSAMIDQQGSHQLSPVMSGGLAVPGLSPSPSLTPCEPWPLTPGALLSPACATAPDSGKTLVEPIDDILGRSEPAFDEVIVISSGPNVLKPPHIARRPKPTPNQSAEESAKVNELGRQLHSILKKDTPSIENLASVPATTSYFAGSSIPGAPVRRNSQRDRLGLGMTFKHQATSPPWTACGPEDESRIQKETSSTPDADRFQKRKSRLSIFKK